MTATALQRARATPWRTCLVGLTGGVGLAMISAAAPGAARAGTAAAENAPAPQEWAARAGAAGGGDVARGRYITHHVAMCVQCHTPRDASGQLDETRLFRGARMPVTSPFAGQRWATQAPSIAGPSAFDPEDELALLTTGARRDGRVPQPPMPPFRLTREDALAVIAYLRSLDSGS